jgi:tRNA pseudouridine32 synthase/23S rRNA pseudouridine746 synthase
MNSRPYTAPSDTGLDILHADSAILVVNKPGGLLSVPGRGAGKADCLASRVQARFPDALVVHRLDMETSGLMVLARNRETHRLLSISFQDRQVEKRYEALVTGQLANASGEIDLPLIADWPNRPLQKVDLQIGKPSLTRYLALAYDARQNSTRVALEPHTGRSHQLRVHMLSLGHPILGDTLYAPESCTQVDRLMLHAVYLAFVHPVHGEKISFSSTAPF